MFKLGVRYIDMESGHTAKIVHYYQDAWGKHFYQMIWDNAVAETSGTLKECRAAMKEAGDFVEYDYKAEEEAPAEVEEEATEDAPAEDQPEEVEEEPHTTGYDSYVSQFPQKPEYTRETIPQFGGKPFNAWVREHGGDPDKAKRGTKLLDSISTSETIPTADGGYIEAMWDDSAGVIVVLLIPPDQAEAYRRYQAPLPLWSY